MTCSSCGTQLPTGAMFCGECGRAVAPAGAATSQGRAASATGTSTHSPARATKPNPVVDDLVEPSRQPEPPAVVEPERVIKPTPARLTPAVPEALPNAAVVDDDSEADLSIERCAQCGAILEPNDIFCGECGFVRHNATAAPRPNDTVSFDPFPWGLPRSHDGVREITPEPESVPEPTPEPVPVELPADDLDETRIVDRSASGERFVLQFSTGESVSVTGTGLIGRNPVAEPSEYFDLVLPISDPGKSVSKTHLEFGQEAGAFWVSDRFSGNGTVVREPERQPRRCEPGKRYRLLRGSRVDIGEQFFIVS